MPSCTLPNMYKTPTLQDFQRSLDNNIHEAENLARLEKGRITSQLAARGLAQSGALISNITTRMDEIHQAAVEKAMRLVHEFVNHGALSPNELGAVAKKRLEHLGASLIGQIPSAGLSDNILRQQQQKYIAVFLQRVDGAVRDIEVGIISGSSVAVKDTDLQDILLRKFYANRVKGWAKVPVNSDATQEEKLKAYSICEQLSQKNLIEWRGLIGTTDGMGRITAQGVDYIERGVAVHVANTTVSKRRKSEKFEILDSPKQMEGDIAEAEGILGIACLYMDIDGFKALNTRFSESVVDRYIIPPFQKLLAAALGRLGFAYQEGGDEIVVVLPNATLGMATEFAEAFRRMLSEQVFTVNGTDDVLLKISVGIAYVGNGENREQLKEKANHALRQAKEAGRNKVCIYHHSDTAYAMHTTSPVANTGLLAIGPDIICVGDISRVTVDSWTLRIKQFIAGDEYKLVSFIDGFASAPPEDRYILSSALGDGRLLAATPSLSKENDGHHLLCPISPAFTRINAQQLGSGMAIHPETEDLYVSNGQIARVSGLEYLPQKIRSLLSMQRGESVFAHSFGMRFFEYFEEYKESPWLSRIMMLDVIRQAAIPYNDVTPLQCITRVHNIELLSEAPINNKLPIRVDFDVQGVGRWQYDLEIYMPTSELIAERA